MDVLILFLLIVLNGIFATSEMGVVSARKACLQQLADEGRAGAGAALALANEPSHFLSTVQIGITLIGITSGAFGEATVAVQLIPWLSQWAALAPYRGAAVACYRRHSGHVRCSRAVPIRIHTGSTIRGDPCERPFRFSSLLGRILITGPLLTLMRKQATCHARLARSNLSFGGPVTVSPEQHWRR